MDSGAAKVLNRVFRATHPSHHAQSLSLAPILASPCRSPRSSHHLGSLPLAPPFLPLAHSMFFPQTTRITPRWLRRLSPRTQQCFGDPNSPSRGTRHLGLARGTRLPRGRSQRSSAGLLKVGGLLVLQQPFVHIAEPRSTSDVVNALIQFIDATKVQGCELHELSEAPVCKEAGLAGRRLVEFLFRQQTGVPSRTRRRQSRRKG